MDSSFLVVPETIDIGFQNREDTYTGKLAFITYTGGDSSDILSAWHRWRDHRIEPIKNWINRPKEGFLLNRDVQRNGGVGWKARSVIRVWDPDGWEFEITPANLLLIMDTCDTNRKEIRGECLYAWDVTDDRLILLPTASTQYKEAIRGQ